MLSLFKKIYINYSYKSYNLKNHFNSSKLFFYFTIEYSNINSK